MTDESAEVNPFNCCLDGVERRYWLNLMACADNVGYEWVPEYLTCNCVEVGPASGAPFYEAILTENVDVNQCCILRDEIDEIIPSISDVHRLDQTIGCT